MNLFYRFIFTAIAICMVSMCPLMASAADPGKSKELFDFGKEMSRKEMKQSGLDQLEPEQMEQLNSWMRGYLGQEEEKMRVEMVKKEEEIRVEMVQKEEKMRVEMVKKEEEIRVEMVQKEEKMRVERRKTKERFFGFFNREDKLKEIAAEEVVEAIESRILGDFYGWRGNTVFHLENGQVWKQGKTGGTYARKFTDTEIIIRKRGESYWLRIKDAKASVPVIRVR